MLVVSYKLHAQLSIEILILAQADVTRQSVKQNRNVLSITGAAILGAIIGAWIVRVDFIPEIMITIALLLIVPVLFHSKHLLPGFYNRIYLGNFYCTIFLVFIVCGTA